MIPLIFVLTGCPKQAPTPEAAPPPVFVAEEERRDPPLPPPAPVDLAFAWPNGSACLMATRNTETLSTTSTVISTLTGVGSGVVFAMRQDDGTWGVSLEDRSGTARHTPSSAGLLTLLEEINLGLQPTLIVSADGRSVNEVRGVEDALAKHQRELTAMSAEYNTEVEALWAQQLPLTHSDDALRAAWAAAWAEGWGFAYGRSWVAGEVQQLEAATGLSVQATYVDVVPCKFNEDEPLCVRLEVAFPEAPVAEADARLRAYLPPGAERSAQATSRTGRRTGELVVEAATGLPWRWTALDVQEHVYAWGDRNKSEFRFEQKQDVSCDWRVAE